MHSQPKQWHRTKKTDQILKDWEKQQLVPFTSICCFWPAIYQSLLWSWPDERRIRRDDISRSTLRRCYIWVHPSFLWFTAGSLDTSDALSRIFCATYSQVRIRFSKAKLYVYLLFLACHLPIVIVILVGQMNKMNFKEHFLIYARTLLNLSSSLFPRVYSWKFRQIRCAIKNIQCDIFASQYQIQEG